VRPSTPSSGRPRGQASAIAIEESDLLLAAEQVQAMRDPERVPGKFGFHEEKV
jgi:hypothetical protein